VSDSTIRSRRAKDLRGAPIRIPHHLIEKGASRASVEARRGEFQQYELRGQQIPPFLSNQSSMKKKKTFKIEQTKMNGRM
jgi:hypothetical protein